VKHSSDLATNQDYRLAEIWLDQSNSLSDFTPADSPVVNPFTIVSDQHSKGTKRSTLNWSSSTKDSSGATTTQPKPLADSEGDHSPPPSKQRCVIAITTNTTTNITKEEEVRVEVGNDFKQPAADSNPSEELKMPNKVNLRESGLTRILLSRFYKNKTIRELFVHTSSYARYR